MPVCLTGQGAAHSLNPYGNDRFRLKPAAGYLLPCSLPRCIVQRQPYEKCPYIPEHGQRRLSAYAVCCRPLQQGQTTARAARVQPAGRRSPARRCRTRILGNPARACSALYTNMLLCVPEHIGTAPMADLSFRALIAQQWLCRSRRRPVSSR